MRDKIVPLVWKQRLGVAMRQRNARMEEKMMRRKERYDNKG